MSTKYVQPGQRVRVTYLRDGWVTDVTLLQTWLRDGMPDGLGEISAIGLTVFPPVMKLVVSKGTVYEGYVADVVDDCFVLNLDSGEAIGLYEHDQSVVIEVL